MQFAYKWEKLQFWQEIWILEKLMHDSQNILGLFHLKSSGVDGLEKIPDAPTHFIFSQTPPTHFYFLSPVRPLRISNGIALIAGLLHPAVILSLVTWTCTWYFSNTRKTPHFKILISISPFGNGSFSGFHLSTSFITPHSSYEFTEFLFLLCSAHGK